MKGVEEEVEDSVDEGHVEAHEGADGRAEEEFSRTDDGAEEELVRGKFLIEFGP